MRTSNYLLNKRQLASFVGIGYNRIDDLISRLKLRSISESKRYPVFLVREVEEALNGNKGVSIPELEPENKRKPRGAGIPWLTDAEYEKLKEIALRRGHKSIAAFSASLLMGILNS